MLSGFSVKKPFFILAGAIVVLMLGAFSLTYMKTNLLPSIDLPYLAVITTDPGAAPEQVENDITNVLDNKLATVTGVQNVYSTSAENYSMVYLEFAENTNMDSALVKVSAAVNEVSGSLPDSAGTPMYLEISMDSIATMYLGVSDSEMDRAHVSQFVEDTMVPAFERQEGVASASVSGSIVQKVDVSLSNSKIEDVNNKILSSVNDKLYDSKKQLDEAQSQLNSAKSALETQKAALTEQQAKAEEELASGSLAISQTMASKQAYEAQLTTQQAELAAYQAQYEAAKQAAEAAPSDPTAQATVAALQGKITSLEAEIAITQSIVDQFSQQSSQIEQGFLGLESGKIETSIQLSTAQNQIACALSTLESSQSQLDEGYQNYQSARETALGQANTDALMQASTLSQILAAQDFSMPAGYVEDSNGNKYMLKVGEEIGSLSSLENLVITNIDGVGDIKLSDVANVKVVEESGSGYAKLNGRDGVIVSVTKTSTANTSEVSDAVNTQLTKLKDDNPTLEIMTLTDQGQYITLYISTILQSLLLGAVLAIVVLALFLRDVKPTLVVAFSIPFSVLFALVIMYFWGIDINIMTLGALSLAIGMLVDNSVVVMENIYRLRARGLSAPRAAAQGAKQVTAAVAASTLTTICVFFPFVFTSGLVQQLLVPFALTISFALLASLVVALTVVPALGSKIFAKAEPREFAWFENFKEWYGRFLEKCLRHRAPVLAIAIALLVISIVGVFRMGITLIPDMESSEISLNVTMPEDMQQEEGNKTADQVLSIISSVEGVSEVGCADYGTAMGSMMSGSSAASQSGSTFNGEYVFYAIPDSSITTESAMRDLKTRILDATKDCNCEISDNSSSSMMSSVSSGELQIDLSGENSDTLLQISNDVIGAVEQVEGYKDVSNGQEKADSTIQLKFDYNAVARQGTTVAQIYQQIASKLNATADTSLSVDSDGDSVSVSVVDERNQITPQNLLDTEYTVSEMGSGDASASGGKTSSFSSGSSSAGSSSSSFSSSTGSSESFSSSGSSSSSSASADSSTKTHKLSEVATATTVPGVATLSKTNGTHSMQVTAQIDDGYNTTLLSRQLEPKLDALQIPDGYSVKISGTDEDIATMLTQMLQLSLLGAVLIYLIMMAQFQSFMSPFIVILTVPLAFTGGFFALLVAGEQLSMMALLGFVILMGTVVNNGIVFVDYVNQLRIAGMEKKSALIAAGKTRMRPILMTALTTILSMCAIVFSPAIGSGMQRGMALVVAGGLLYATAMTLIVVPIVYDIFCRKPLKTIEIGDDVDLDSGDAEYFMDEAAAEVAESLEAENVDVYADVDADANATPDATATADIDAIATNDADATNRIG